MTALPNEIPTVRVTGTYRGPDGRALKGTVTFSGPSMLTFADSDLFIAGSVAASLDESGQIIDADGNVGVLLPATDAPGMNPSGWTYTVKENLTGVVGARTYSMVLPKDTLNDTLDLADVAPADPTTPTYVAVPGPSAYEVAVAQGFTGTEDEWLASLVGPQGVAGSKILTGSAAPTASQGVDGDFFTQYTTTTNFGVTSTTVTNWAKSAGAWSQVGGDVRGAQWILNSGSTSSAGVPQGDNLLRTDTGDVYQRGATGWDLKGNLKGPKGDTGTTGATGPQGPQGAPGVVQSVNGISAADVTIDAASVGAVPTTDKGIANGVATLGADGLVPASQLPSSSGSGTVTSVNSVAPDGSGNVTLTAANVGAIATTAKGAASGVASLGSDTRLPIAQVPSALPKNVWTPQSLGFQAWSCDPTTVIHNQNDNKAAALQRVYFAGMNITEPTTVSKVVVFAVGWAGSTAVPAARFYAGIYNESGTRVATSGQVSSLGAAGQDAGTPTDASSNHVGAVPIPLTGSVTLQPGRYWAAFNHSAGSATDFYYFHIVNWALSNPSNFTLAPVFFRAGYIDAQTSLPASITPSSMHLDHDPIIMALA